MGNTVTQIIDDMISEMSIHENIEGFHVCLGVDLFERFKQEGGDLNYKGLHIGTHVLCPHGEAYLSRDIFYVQNK